MDLFKEDTFTSRRTTGHNMYDPESLLTGEEIANGFSYNDPRQYQSEEDYLAVVEGRVPASEVAKLAPRVKSPFGYKVVLPKVGKSDAVAIRFKTFAEAKARAAELYALFESQGFPARWVIVPANYVFIRRLLAWAPPSELLPGEDHSLTPEVPGNPVIDRPVIREL